MRPTWVSLAVDDRVALLSMARPPVNAMSRTFMSELEAGLDQAATDPAVRVIIVTSKLPGMFSGGADIRELEGLDADGARCYAEAYVAGDAREGIRAFLEKRPARFPDP